MLLYYSLYNSVSAPGNTALFKLCFCLMFGFINTQFLAFYAKISPYSTQFLTAIFFCLRLDVEDLIFTETICKIELYLS